MSDLNEKSLADACTGIDWHTEEQLIRSWNAFTKSSSMEQLVQQMNGIYRLIKGGKSAYPDPHQRSLTKEKS